MQKTSLRILAGWLLACPLFAQPAPAIPQPGLKLNVEQLKAQIHVTAGRRLRPKSWPNGARVAVALSFDVDNQTTSLARGDLTPGVLSRGEYGAIEGLPRILDLTETEAAIYVRQCLTGPAKAGDLAASLKLHRNEVYRAASRPTP